MARERKASTIGADTDLSALDADEARELLASVLTPDPRGGVLQLSGSRCVVVRPEVIVNIQKQLEQTIGGSAKGIMYLAGERSSAVGLDPLEPVASGAQGPLTLEKAKRAIEASAVLGWGRAEIAAFDPDRNHFALTIRNSPLASAYGPSKKPVCHFLSGWIAGIGRLLVKKEFLCEETACAAQGRERCEFELRLMPSA